MVNQELPNPYNVFNVRRIDFPPDSFKYATIPFNYNIGDSISKWIENNLKSRYYLGKSVVLDDQNQIQQVIKIGFEEAKELSYFMLACPHLKYK